MKIVQTTVIIVALVTHLAVPARAVEPGSAGASTTLTVGTANAITTAPANVYQDIRLKGPQHQLSGTVLDQAGNPRSGADITVSRAQRVIVRGRTDAKGRFRINGLSGGLYHLTIGEQVVAVRAWTDAAAPPIAQDELTVTPAPHPLVVRGQRPLCELFGPEPLLLGVLIAAAIAIPIAVHDSGSNDVPNGS
jgi:hypothetical protein